MIIKIYLRKCVGCGKMLDRKNLFRIIRISETGFYICKQDKNKKENKIHGRSAYMCRSMNCFERSKKIKAFEHSFKSSQAKIIYEELFNELKKIF